MTNRYKSNVLIILIVLLPFILFAQESKIQLGAYYFNGWSPGSKHITKSLVDSFKERESKWGWATGTPEIMKDQINLAADAGLSFFSFCWYYTKNKSLDSSNKIIIYYLNSPNRGRLKFCLLVANHKGHTIAPDVWPILIREWIKLFKIDSYLTVNSKPLIVFFSLELLLKKFGGPLGVNKALSVLKKESCRNGLNGVSIAVCVSPDANQVTKAKECGFDILTGYSYHNEGLKGINGRSIPIDTMTIVDEDCGISSSH